MRRSKVFRIVQSQKIYQGHVVRLVKDRFVMNREPGKLFTRELVIHPGAVVVLPMADRHHVVLLRQFRYAAKGDLWEIPAGTLEKGERTLTCAKRELEEETGYRAKRWKFLTRFFPAPGMSDELMTLYRAEGLSLGKKNLDHDEWITHEIVHLKKARGMIQRGQIRDAKSIIGLLWDSLVE